MISTAPHRPASLASAVVRALTLGGILVVGLGGGATWAAPAEDHSKHVMPAGLMHSEQAVVLPEVMVTRADGKRMALAEALNDGRPVLLNFVYTTCTAICPVTSQVFNEFRERIGASEREQVNMVSISIDPEQDTPKRLSAYAKRFGSAGTWSHYTSSSADAVAIQKAFGAWRGDKMNHQPTTYLRGAPGKAWQRFDGFIGPRQLVEQYLNVQQGLGADACADPSMKSVKRATGAGGVVPVSLKVMAVPPRADHPRP
ncbi:MAG: hypothetical protein RL722_84 [Pseudomonadota bacterium]